MVERFNNFFYNLIEITYNAGVSPKDLWELIRIPVLVFLRSIAYPNYTRMLWIHLGGQLSLETVV